MNRYPPHSRKWMTITAIFILLASLACNLPGSFVGSTQEPAEESGALPGEQAAPTVDVSQLPPTAPRIVARRPASGEELPLDGSIDVYFDQPMDRASVEESLRLEPALDFSLTWVDDSTVRITPQSGQLDRASVYEVLIGKEAASQEGLSLEDDAALEVQTVGFLEVGEVIPAPNAEAVGTDAVITAFFNRPVVPLMLVEDMGSLPQPLSFEPDIPGTGEWVNTSIYLWKPDQPLAGGVEYTVTVGAGLTDQTGGVLQEAYSWQFETIPPAVLSVQPSEASQGMPLDTVVSVEFNQPVDRASAQSAFSLVENNANQSVNGTFEWSDDGKTMTFQPSALLPLGGDFTASVAAGVRSASGEVATTVPYTWGFTSVPVPALLYTSPADNGQGVEVWRGISLIFASPMERETIEERLTIEPEIPESATYYGGLDYGAGGSAWRFNINTVLEPSTTYTVTLEAGAADPYGNTIDEPYTFSFTTGPLEPMVSLNTNGFFGLYDASRPTELFAVYRNIDYIDFTIAQISVEQFGDFIRPSGLDWTDYTPPEDQVIREWRVTADAELNETAYANIEAVEGGEGSLPAGIYLLIADAPEIRGDLRHFMVVADANLTYKASFDESLVWLTDLDSGQPVSGAAVRFYDNNFNQVAEGTTGADGTLELETPHEDDLWENRFALVDDGQTFALAMSDWGEGIQPWDFSLSGNFDFDSYSLYLYTDRPLYRPGQEVYFKGVLRGKNDVTYTLPKLSQLQVIIYNDQGEEVYREMLPVSEFGTLNGAFTIDPDATLGYYTIEAGVYPASAQRGFQVAEYRKPEFTVTAQADEDEVLDGEEITVTVDASFFFGGPVSDAEVTWSVLSAPYGFDYQGLGRYQFGDYDYTYRLSPDYIPGYGEVIADGVGQTGADGKLLLTIPANLDDVATSRRFTIEAVVTDVNERTVAGRTEVIVHKAGVYVGVQPDVYVGQVDQEMSASLIVVDWESEPVPDREVTVQPVQLFWNSVQEEDEYGRTQWTWSVERVPVGDPIQVTTDEDGEASVTFVPPEGGTYKLEATVADQAGNTTLSSAFFWVSSFRYVSWRQSNDNRFELIADRDQYQPGDTAQILIASPFAGDNVQALVTVERGSILQSEVITLGSNSTIYELPITGALAPNVYVSVVIVKGVDETNPVPAFKMGDIKLTVDPVEQTLQVSVTPDREQVGPREEVTFTVETTDFAGNPVDAEVSLALVDLATLSLASPNSGPILEHFYGNQGLGVRTAVPMIFLVDRLNQELFDKGKGGGGGGAEGFFDIRSQFEDTAYWSATVQTGEDGTATVSLTLPDNLTTWRMDARAVTAETLVGQTEVDIVATKPLLIRPVTPRFFVIGDETTLSAVVNNNTGAPVDAVVSLQAQGVILKGEAAQQVSIPAGGRVEVTWPVVVEASAEWVDLVFGVQGGDLSDASRPPLGDPARDRQIPVYKYEVPETVGTAGQMPEAGERTEGIVLPPTYEVTQGEVLVQVNPSLAAATLDGLRWLEQYPYLCTEQTVSRFLPNVLTLRTLRDFGLSDDELEANLNINTSAGLQRLYAEQHVDGGWGWFVQSPSSPTVSAYVVQGLVVAKDAGLQVDESVLSRGLNYLRGQLTSLDALDQQYKLNRQAYLLYVLALAGEPDVSRTVQLYDSRESIQLWAQALVAQSMWMINPADSRLDNLKSDLASAAILSATGAHWEEQDDDVWNWNTDTRTTAIMLDTFVQLWPDNELNPNVVRWLMVARQADHWQTTQETVWSLNGLTRWMSVTGELDADYDWEFIFNGTPLASGEANAGTVRQTTAVVIDVADLVTDAVNRLTFDRTDGPGRLYYTAHLTAFLPVEQIEPLSRGVAVSRRYLDADGEPVTQARVGDILTAEVTIIAPTILNYIVVEDPYPAGAEAVDASLLTESVLTEPAGLNYDDPLRWGWGWWFFSEVDLRDEKAVLYADSLPPGTYQFTYQIRMGLEGVYRVIPPAAWEFYFPEVYGRGEGMLFTVLPEE